MLGCAKWLLLATAVSMVALQSNGQYEGGGGEDNREGRDLLDWLGLGTGPDTDPYLARTNAACLNGDLAECFKSRALASLDEFFNKAAYHLTENARIIRMPVGQLRTLSREPYEYSQSPRADEPEWDQLVKFVMRKAEKFLKSTAIEVQFNNEVTEEGRYSPRFVDEIADEIDIIEDKKDSIFNRKQLKKLFIPMLIILKLFKLKLLLFLPLILGLASFKKLLGFLAIVIPGLIGFFKLCKPDLGSSLGAAGLYGSPVPHYSPAGLGYPQNQGGYFSGGGHTGGGLVFREEGPYQQGYGHGHENIPYRGYGEYRSAGDKEEKEKPKKSILPDS